MLTLKNVIAGNTYYAEYSANLGDYAIINCDKDCNLTTSLGGIQISRKEYWKSNGWSCKNNIRLATDEEKAWLQHCIKEDKFVEYEEFMKAYKPQFIVGQWYKYNNHIGKFYSYDNGIFQVSEYIHKKKYYNSHSNWGSKDKDTEKSLATIEEFQEFLPLDHPDKQLDIKQIQEECKRRFPIGCKYISADGIKKQYILIQDETVYEINDSYIYASDNQGCLYYKGKYAELIETLEMIIPEYVEYVNTLYKGTIVKVEDWCCGSYCKVIFYNGNKEQPFKHLVKYSTKSAYDLQNLKQQPLTLKQCYNTEIEVGDEVECVEGIGNSGIGFSLGLKFIVHSISNYEPEKCYFGGVGGNGVYKNHLKLIKKANKNTTTTTLNKKVDVSSPKVTDKITVPRINTTSYDTLVHINIETNTKSIKIPKLETNTPEIKKIKIQSLTLTI